MSFRNTILKSAFGLTILGSLFFVSCKHEPVRPKISGTDTTKSGTDTTKTGTSSCHPDSVYFNRDIQPLLASSCATYGCHDAGSAQKDVVMTDYQSIMASDIVRPNRPENSKLYEVITEPDPEDRMPLQGSGIVLTEAQKELIRKWIAQGAKNNKCTENSGCNTQNMSFARDVFPIIQTNCVGCHSSSSPSDGVNLSTYSAIEPIAKSGRLYGSISRSTGFKPMPFGQPKMSDCNIARIKSWIDAGAPNN